MDLLEKVEAQKKPHHVAIIMDGNGRWARERGLPRHEGHRQGVEAVRETVRSSHHLGIKVLTLFAFSTENWRRPSREVSFLMSLPEQYLEKELPELMSNDVRVRLVGEKDGLPQKVRRAVENGAKKTAGNRGMLLNFALNYGSRQEILRAVNALITERSAAGDGKRVSAEEFSSYLFTSGIPDPDLLIRTSGELRLSNFLLWQLAYSELWFTPVYWPDFTRAHLLEALQEYQRRKRRYGRVDGK